MGKILIYDSGHRYEIDAELVYIPKLLLDEHKEQEDKEDKDGTEQAPRTGEISETRK